MSTTPTSTTRTTLAVKPEHPVTPEDLMALLDGELPADRAQSISAHTESCDACSKLLQELRQTKHSLAAWKVSPAPASLEAHIEAAAKPSSVLEASGATSALGRRAWSSRQRAIGLGLGAATVLLVFFGSVPNLLHSRMAANEASSVGSLRTINTAIVEYRANYGHYPNSLRQLGPSAAGQASENGADLIDPALADGNKSGYRFSYGATSGSGYSVKAEPTEIGSTGNRRFSTDQTGVLRADGAPLDGDVRVRVAEKGQQSIGLQSYITAIPASRGRPVEGRSVNGLVALDSALADSNGKFHGQGDHLENSFSRDGQALSDQQARIFSGPMIARTVSLAILVKDFDVSRKSLDAILLRHNGYSANLTVNTPQGASRSLNASLRVPAPQLAAALAELKSLGHVENESQNGEEVTQQHADLVARLKNSRETEQRLQAILTQRTGKISDVLEVEQEIARVRGEIEQMEAEQKNLEHRVDFATIDLQLGEEYKVKLDSGVPSFSTRFHNALVNGHRNVADTLVALVLFFAEYGPILVFWAMLLAIPAWLLWRRWRQTAVAL
jgi:hypothetical protein